MGANLKSSKQAEVEAYLNDKSELEIEEDFFSMTVICYLKHTAEEYMILPSKQSQLFY